MGARYTWLKKLFWVVVPVWMVLLAGLLPVEKNYQTALTALRAADEKGTDRGIADDLRIVIEWLGGGSEFRVRLGDSEFSVGNWREAIAAYEDAQKQSGLMPDRLLKLAFAYLQVGDEERAILIYRELVEENIALPLEIYEMLSMRDWEAGLYKDAEKDFRLWLEADPNSPAALFHLGLLSLQDDLNQGLDLLMEASALEGIYSQAVEELRTAVNIALLSDDVSYQLVVTGRSLGNLGYWSLAVEHFQKAALLNPDYAEAWAFWGEAQQQLGMDGLPQLEQALKIDPKSTAALALMGYYWQRKGKSEDALVYYQKLIELEPDEPTWKVEIGILKAQLGDINTGLAYLQDAAESNPKDALYWRQLAGYCVDYNVEVREIGLPAARQALLLEESDSANLDSMGMVLMALDDLISAERYLYQAIVRDGLYAPAHFHLGQLYLQKGKKDLAYQELNTVVDLLPEDSEMRKKAEALLKLYWSGIP
jgi:tetratricopeptide (TPR) repeat protein